MAFNIEQARKINIDTPVVTFDQSLSIKAMEIVTTLNILMVILLGGFHKMMIFAGSIGTLMKGSGFDVALEIIHGQVSVRYMLSGKAIAMFIQGNFLVESALVIKILSNLLPSANDTTGERILYIICAPNT